MVEERSHGGFSVELQNLYCLGKQLTSKQASKQRASKSGNQAIRRVFCLLAYLLESLAKTQVNSNEALLTDGSTTPYPPVQSQSSKSKYYSAKPIADWFDRSAEALAMVGALVPPTPKICNQHPYHYKDNFN